MQFSGERALFAGAHLDDIEFGCGGLVARFCNELDMRFLTLTKKTRASTGEVQIVRDLEEPYRAAEALGITAKQLAIEDLDGQLLQGQAQQVREVFLRWRRDFDPDIIFVPARDDIHQDHHVVFEEAVRIFRDRTVIGFEVVRSTLSFRPSLFVGIGDEHLEKKIGSIMAYQSQLDPQQSAGYYFKPEIIRGQAAFRGGQSNNNLAEAFEVYLMHI
jgi:N-acetylglucosamine malate deacetylase 1